MPCLSFIHNKAEMYMMFFLNCTDLSKLAKQMNVLIN